ncbi:long-chain fatty acid--CoA ligase [Nanchangia anserum]|uniref:Acyl-CoA synthetase n=1 Tax=Nanchangia anserum TaxID=2692125 RepID=A0A8I0GDT3_9ACTO|nr:AMP-dependent synthetase/ligase [Nanchangia anserum]MBD3689022.1 long-chain fatty acid--CoA ligase [Nanchangia anserum]QOX81267.1 long-chain fatty acid--CoA ligase [Nanchangia anserum]
MVDETLGDPPADAHTVPDATGEGLREFGLPRRVATEEWMSIPWLFYRRVQADPKQIVVEKKSSLGDVWRPISARAYAEEIAAVARGLIGLGLGHGDRLGILAPTSYDWTLLDMAALSIGVVVVPIYETDSAAQIRWIIEDAQLKLIVSQARQSADLLGALVRELGVECPVMCLTTGAMVDIVEAGDGIKQADYDARYAEVNMSTLASIVYTSGTTGRPKGVEITHGNGVELALNGLEYMGAVTNTRKVRALMFLPLAHVLARFVTWYTLAGPGVLGHVPDTSNLLADVASFRPTYVLVVPRVLEKIYNSAEAMAGSGVKLRMFRAAAKTAIAYSRALDTAEGPSRRLRAAHQFYSTIVLSKIHALLGGNCDYVISGGGPLGRRLGHFYRGAGLTVLEGYGLTETLGPFMVNTATAPRIGSVGRPVYGGQARISSEGEIQLKGPFITRGYYGNPEATAATFTSDGWFKTGDAGRMDAQGYTYITGRMKEIIVTAGGKNVAPETLEDSLRGHPLISQVVVVGDRRPFIGALITLDRDMVPMWLANHKLPAMDIPAAVNHPEVIAALERAVERANKAVSRAESIRKIRVLSTEFTEENGLLTPSMKVKRKVVLERFADEIDALYGTSLEDDDE